LIICAGAGKTFLFLPLFHVHNFRFFSFSYSAKPPSAKILRANRRGKNRFALFFLTTQTYREKAFRRALKYSGEKYLSVSVRIQARYLRTFPVEITQKQKQAGKTEAPARKSPLFCVSSACFSSL
jgi:hypothetical protein